MFTEIWKDRLFLKWGNQLFVWAIFNNILLVYQRVPLCISRIETHTGINMSDFFDDKKIWTQHLENMDHLSWVSSKTS